MLREAVAQALEAFALRERRLLLAVSGGVDSVVLAHALHELAEAFGLKLSIGHVNHGLRGEASEADEAFVRELGQQLGIPVACRRIDPANLCQGPSQSRPSLQEAARKLRRQALLELAAELGAEHIATAHNADDQAETVLLRLLRGTGPDGLGGIPETSADGVWVRPLLRVPRAEILAFAHARRISWREDASNQNTGYARNRLRHRWLPGLAQDFNPQLLRSLADLAEAQRRDSEWIAAQVDREAESRFSMDEGGHALLIDRKDWLELPEALARRLVRQAWRRLGGGRDVSRTHLERMLDFLRNARPGKRISLPGGLELACEAGAFRLAHASLKDVPRGNH